MDSVQPRGSDPTGHDSAREACSDSRTLYNSDSTSPEHSAQTLSLAEYPWRTAALWDGDLLHAALFHLPLVRLAVRAEFDDAATDRRPPFCSQAVASAYRLGAQVDPVPNLSDRITAPGDLARSPFFKLVGRLVP